VGCATIEGQQPRRPTFHPHELGKGSSSQKLGTRTDQGPPGLGRSSPAKGGKPVFRGICRDPPVVSQPFLGLCQYGRRAENSFYFAAASGTFSLSSRSALHLSINLLVHHRSYAVYGYLLRDTPEILRLLAQVALHWRMQPKARPNLLHIAR